MYDSTVNDHKTLRVLIYSDDSTVRAQVISALGERPHPSLPAFVYSEVATEPVVFQLLDAGGIDLVILDGEAVPVGGMEDEIFKAPPVLLLTGRVQDAWLATWSRADAAVPHPIEPLRLAEAVIDLVRSERLAG